MSKRTKWLLSIGVIAALVFGWQIAAFASHDENSLPGSDFEIDTDANLKVDDPAPSIDWLNAGAPPQDFRSGVTVKEDEPSGSGDDSFGQGTKEDTAVPTVVSGSIPPNKSDLLNFGVYLESTATQDFLTVFWHRVQEPSGTTNMDFEFNQSSTLSSNGKTPVRTSGDILIQYDLSQGGTNPQLFLSNWIDGTEGATAADCEAANRLPCWDERTNLSASGDAAGSINTSAIPAAESGGLGPISPRTFGEAHVDLAAITPPDADPCQLFGSAYLKSRSSDSFTAALKDFIAPTTLNLNECGALEISKTDSKTGNALAGAVFTIEDANGDPIEGSPFTTGDDGTVCVDSLTAGDYTVTETAAPGGYVIDDPAPRIVTVTAPSTCAGTPATTSFEDTPTSDIQVRFRDGGSGVTSAVISCDNPTGTTDTADTTGWDDTTTVTGIHAPVTVTCTIVIDP